MPPPTTQLSPFTGLQTPSTLNPSHIEARSHLLLHSSELPPYEEPLDLTLGSHFSTSPKYAYPHILWATVCQMDQLFQTNYPEFNVKIELCIRDDDVPRMLMPKPFLGIFVDDWLDWKNVHGRVKELMMSPDVQGDWCWRLPIRYFLLKERRDNPDEKEEMVLTEDEMEMKEDILEDWEQARRFGH